MTMASFKNKVASFLLCVTLLSLMADSRSTCGKKYDSSVVERRFESWLKQHDRHYKDRGEWMLRFGIYQTNLNFIDFINSQNPYVGSCWAFSAVAAVEGANQIKTGKLAALSQQELVDCDTKGRDKGCKGGYMDDAFKYIQDNKGISTEQDYPYTGTQGPCKAPANKTVLISGYKKVTANSEDSLLEAVAQQPVSVALESKGYAFQLYKSGIFKGVCGAKLDHGVVLVGYGEEGGDKFWIVRNSWGTKWGEQGYMRLLRGAAKPQGTCGIAMRPSYPLAA